MSKIFGSFLMVFFLVFLTPVNAKDNCYPEFEISKSALSNQSTEESEDKSVFIYFDQSLSMQGYTKDQPGQNNLYVNVIDDLQQIAENIGSKTYYHSFGKAIKPIKENEISRVIKPSFYECTESASECNNQESKISDPFKAAKARPDGTYIIVTDLFLANKQLVSGSLNQLTKPLKSLLKKGKSIGIIGVMSSFNGTIYDIPTREGGTVSYTEAQKRPFYIIMIGDQKEINQVKKNLEEQHFTNPEDKYKFSLITSSPVLQNLNNKKLITEKNIKNIYKAENFSFEYDDRNLAVFAFDTNNKRKINFKVKKPSFEVSGSTGIGEFLIKERLWTSTETKCKKINWEEAKLDNISSVVPNEEDLHIKMFDKKNSLKNLFRGWRYFYVAEIYANKPGSASEDTFKEWSIRETEAEEFKDGNPIEFKTLNLTKIIRILNSVANDEFEPTLIASVALDFDLTK